MKQLKVIGLDILGVLLIIASAAFGWLPGPGGIPLFFAGLACLAANHEWARRLLRYFQKNGVKFMEMIFREHRALMIAYDVIAIILICLAGYVLTTKSGNILQGASIVLVFLGLSLFLGNRKRMQKINRFVRRVTKKQP